MKKSIRRTVKALALLGLLTGLFLGVSTIVSAAGNTITKSEAKKIALDKANVKEASVKKWTKVKLDNWDDDNSKEWDVEFKTSTYQYEVEINARTGKVEDFEKKKISTVKISKKKAKEIALQRADVTSSQVKKWTKVKLDGKEWEIKFQTSTHKYELEINARTGKVKDFEKKKIKSAKISQAKAKEIALQHAKKNASITGKIKHFKAELDNDDGMTVYEIEFQYKQWEFDYEIDAKTGAILDWSMEYDD